jgi:hypothetical protein
MEKVFLSGQTIQATIKATMSHAIFFSKNLDDNSNYEAGVINFSNGKKIEGQPEEFSKMNELTGMFMLSSGIQARVSDKSLVDSLEGTVV